MIAQLDARYVRARPRKALTRLISYLAFEGRPVTTRGQWINPFVFRFLNFAGQRPVGEEPDSPIFIVGTGRSGTTILGKILSLHPAVGFLNEPKAAWHTAYPAEDVIGNYSRGPARYRLEADDANDRTTRTIRRIYGTYLCLTRTGRVLDKYPEMIFRVPFVRRIFPNATFIFLARDGWDTIRSIGRWSDRLGREDAGETRDWWGVDDRKWKLLVREIVANDPAFSGRTGTIESLDRHLDRAAVEWTVTMREGMQWLERDPTSFRLIRYEELVRDPRQTLLDLIDDCELRPDETLLRYATDELRERSHKPAAELHPAVERPFLRTMKAMEFVR